MEQQRAGGGIGVFVEECFESSSQRNAVESLLDWDGNTQVSVRLFTLGSK
jgi:hypothetical protein